MLNGPVVIIGVGNNGRNDSPAYRKTCVVSVSGRKALTATSTTAGKVGAGDVRQLNVNLVRKDMIQEKWMARVTLREVLMQIGSGERPTKGGAAKKGSAGSKGDAGIGFTTSAS